MNEAQKLCENHLRIDRKLKIIKKHNRDRSWQAFDESEAHLIENCLNCDKYPSLMVRKVCFKYRRRYRVRFLLQDILKFPFTHRVKIVPK